jgi:hypothetical protein
MNKSSPLSTAMVSSKSLGIPLPKCSKLDLLTPLWAGALSAAKVREVGGGNRPQRVGFFLCPHFSGGCKHLRPWL